MGLGFSRWHAVFASVGVGNYRRLWLGQAGSWIGRWMQITALSWLVFRITGSSGAVGWVFGLQQLPVLLFGSYAGVIVDRFDKRRLMIALQSAKFLQALLLAFLTITGVVQAWHVYLLAVVLGACEAFELPASNVLVGEIVGDDLLANAQSLISVTGNVGSLAGPAVAGMVIAAAGEGWCFLINAASLLGFLVALLRLDRGALKPSPVVSRAPGQLREGLRYAARTPTIALPLLMTALVSLFAFPLPVSLAALSEQVLDSGSQGYGLMLAAVSGGSVIGGVYLARKDNAGLGGLTIASTAAAALMLGVALVPTLEMALVALALLGFPAVAFTLIAKNTVQLAAPAEMRARAVALYWVAVSSGTIGGPILGWIISQAGARFGLGVGAGTFLAVAVIGLLGMRRAGRVAR